MQMAASDLLPGYLQALRTELSAIAALAALPVDELEADPRLRSKAAMRLGRVLDALGDIGRLTHARGTPRRPSLSTLVDALAEGAGVAGPAVHSAMPLLTLARHRAAGTVDLTGLPAERLHQVLASGGRLERWLSAPRGRRSTTGDVS